MVDHNQLLLKWQETAMRLAVIKAEEILLRGMVMDAFFPGAAEGTHNVELGNGYTLKAQVVFNYPLARPSKEVPLFDPTASMLNQLASQSEAGKLIAQRLVKWTPTLSVSEYRRLPDDLKPIVDPVVTIKPGSPQVEIVPPKAK